MFAVVPWRDSVQGLAVSRRDEVVSSEVGHTHMSSIIVGSISSYH